MNGVLDYEYYGSFYTFLAALVASGVLGFLLGRRKSCGEEVCDWLDTFCVGVFLFFFISFMI